MKKIPEKRISNLINIGSALYKAAYFLRGDRWSDSDIDPEECFRGEEESACIAQQIIAQEMGLA